MADDTWEPIEDEEEIIVLTDEEGNEHEFTIAQIIRVDAKDYAVLLPLTIDGHGDDDAEEAIILRIEQEDGEDVLVEIEDEDEFERVAEVWEEMLDEEEDDEEQ